MRSHQTTAVTLGLLAFLIGAFITPLSHAAPDKRVVFINPGFEDRGFWKAVTDTMQAAADQLGFTLDIRYGNREWPRMVQEAEKAISAEEKPDYLILVNEHQQGANLLKKADQAGIPTLMLLNSLTAEQRKSFGEPRQQLRNWLGSITPDNEIAGFEMAESLVAAAKQHGLADDGHIDLLTLAGDNRTPASLFRLQGLDRSLANQPQLKEQRRLAVNWSEQEAYNRTRLWLEGNNPLEAVWAANDPIAFGASKAIREAGKTPGRDVVVSGLNWSGPAIDAVRKGEMTLTHGGHFLAGAWAMVMLYDHAAGFDFARISPEINFPMTAITAENAGPYQQAFSEQQWSRIDFHRFSLAKRPPGSTYEFTLTQVLESVRP